MTIDEYLRALRKACRTRGVASGRLVGEAADYLTDMRDREIARGLNAADAERLAVRTFGSVADVADRLVAEAPSTVLVAERERRTAARHTRPRGPGVAYAALAL